MTSLRQSRGGGSTTATAASSGTRTKTRDDRDIQQKALDKWAEQKEVWARMQANIAKRVGKKPDETLTGSIHHFRQRQEELGMIDTSVPAEIKNGVSAWEMNLRSGVGGVRYVQIGSSFPYPLYCPIRDAETVKPDNHVLMRVLPEHAPQRHKPVCESAYFRARQHEFKKHIRRKYAHFVEDQEAEAFGVVGMPPPLASRPIREDASIEPVVFVPHVEAEGVEGTAPMAAATSNSALAGDDAATAARSSRPLSAVHAPIQSAAAQQQKGRSGSETPAELVPSQLQQQQHEGPMLMFSSSHLSFTAGPGELVQATLTVDNIGSTAVFYSWVPVESEATLVAAGGAAAATTRSGAAGNDGATRFLLSDTLNGVLLPDDQKLFTFGFRAPAGGVHAMQYELLTVPAGKERIVLHLRGVVLATAGDAVATALLEQRLAREAPVVAARAMLTDLTTKRAGNAFDESNVRAAVTERVAEEQRRVAAADATQVARRAQWARHNAALQLPYNSNVYEKLHQLHRNLTTFMRTIEGERAPPQPQAEAATAQQPQPSASPSPTPSASTTRGTPIPGSAPGQGGDAAAVAVASTTTVASPSRAADDAPAEWSGSVQALLGELAAVRDVQVRATFLSALGVLLGAAAQQQRVATAEAEAAAEEGQVEATDTSLRELLLLAASRDAFGEAADHIHLYAQTARDLAEGRGPLRAAAGAVAGKGEKGAGKGGTGGAGGAGSTTAKDKKGPTQQAKEQQQLSGEGGEGAKHPDFDAFFFAGCRRIVGDAVTGLLDRFENNSHCIACMCDRPIEVLVSRRMSQIVEAHATAEAEIEAAPEVATKGKKK